MAEDEGSADSGAEEEPEEEEEYSTREDLAKLGFYDNDYTEFPPELSGVKRFKADGEAEPLIEALQLPGYDVTFMRLEMIEALGRIGDPAAVEVLEGELRDGDTQIEAMEALGRIGSADAVEALADLLDPEKKVKPHVRAKAADTVGEIGGQEAVEPLVEVFEVDAPQVRASAASALGVAAESDADAVEALSELLRDDDEEHVRAAAAKALSEMEADAAADTLAEFEDDHNQLVAEAAR